MRRDISALFKSIEISKANKIFWISLKVGLADKDALYIFV